MNRESLDERSVYKKVSSVIKMNRENNLFHKAFLRPIQIALKTRFTENRKDMDIDSLAFGLKQVIKKDISNNKYTLKNFDSFTNLNNQNKNYRYLVENNYDTLISLIKPGAREQPIEVAICICMYSQDKSMLRKTLAGVSNNIATFVRNGISADKIAVCVVMDGIQKVDSSTTQFFQDMQKQSNIYLDDEVDPIDAHEVARSQQQQSAQEETWNLNNFIFDQIQIIDRKKRRFKQRKKQYLQVRSMINKIQEHQKNHHLTYYDLDDFLKPFFLQKARLQRKKQYNEDQAQLAKVTDDDLLRQYADNMKKSKSILQNALIEAKVYSRKYIQTRDSLALLNCFRVEVNFGSFTDHKRANNYEQLQQQELNEQSVSMNLFMITKYKNSGKLSSHNWFFNGFCKQVPCKYAVLLDVGLTPSKNALYRMYKFMDNDKKCGGVCGYMNLKMQGLDQSEKEMDQKTDCITRLTLKCTDIQRAQQVEYHFGHLIDKPFQSIFNFIHVLPGAFSAYRMSALQLTEKSDSSNLMKQYFRGLDDSANDTRRKSVNITKCQTILRILSPDMFYRMCYPVEDNTDEQLLYDSNVFLAEDRTLCMGIHKNGYNLKYLPDAHGWVDPIKTIPGLLGQRKRWINGSFFAFEKVRRQMTISGCGQFMLSLQILYLAFMNLLAFVSPALFLFTIHIAMFAFRDWTFTALQTGTSQGIGSFQSTQLYNAFVYVIDFIYVMIMLSLVLFSMHFTHRNQRFIPYIYGFSTFFGIMSIIVFVVLLYDMIAGLVDGQTFLISTPEIRQKFFSSLPGGEITFLIYKYTVVAVFGVFIIPVLVYAIFFHRLSFLFEVLCGVFSFLYFAPTYLNILYTFALCRIDDISWGTKGLDTSVGGKAKQLVDLWKTIKLIYVAKFVFWNIIVAAAMLVISSPIVITELTFQQYQQVLADSYVRKFFLTFGIMGIILITLLIKIILGLCYSMKYRCCKKSIKIHKHANPENFDNKISGHFNQVKDSVYLEVKNNISSIVGEVKNSKDTFNFTGLNSLIIHNKSINRGKPRPQVVNKWNKSFKMQSQVVKKKKNSNQETRDHTINANEQKAANGKSQAVFVSSNQSSKNLRSDQDLNEKNKEKTGRGKNLGLL